ncbi:FG-GAP repeat-containing protein [Cardiosporidium cionae]|uniref:FG-GAP repeat-containing protein n=1 Tax=Cardiosporidium cionae TaxID=476202 RepID=A0ABQ7J965_9APIC|nr:FG-GAP repeat-containing protein [Cardiosporidium cionae]|eukprot:KAF8820539.1 FG-GAP repeat-containing protein [Cardiosporidium cionae]
MMPRVILTSWVTPYCQRKRWWFKIIFILPSLLAFGVYPSFSLSLLPRPTPSVGGIKFDAVINAADSLHNFKLNTQVLWNKTYTGNVLEFADYDGDAFVDFISYKPTNEATVISGDTLTASLEAGHISVYLWNTTRKDFVEKVKYVIPSSVTAEVVALVASDFNYDGRNDILVVYSLQNALKNPKYMFEILLQDPSNLTLKSAWKSYPKSSLHVDLDGNFYTVNEVNELATSNVVSIQPSVSTTKKDGAANFLDSMLHYIFFWWKTGKHIVPDEEDAYAAKSSMRKEFILQKVDPPPFGSILGAQPLLADVDADGRIDLISQVFTENGTAERIVFLNKADTQNNNNFEFQLMNWTRLTDFIENASLPYAPIAHPHSSAFIDINGDQRSDIILMVYSGDPQENKGYTLEIWLNLLQNQTAEFLSDAGGRSKYVRYNMTAPVDIPFGAGQISFADMNADGSIDLLIPTCQRSTPFEICTGKSEILLYKNTRIKEKEVPLNHPFLPLPHHSSPIHFEFSKGTVVYTTPDSFKASSFYPTTLRIGDYDNDGYPDVLTVIKSNNASVEFARLLKNKQGVGLTETVDLTIADPSNSSKVMIYGSAFFDVFEDGNLDLVLLGAFSSNIKTTFMHIFQPSFEFDGLFLKTVALNGICIADCTKNGRYRKYPYGVSAHGPAFRISAIDINGRKRYRSATQLTQSTFSPLQMPFVYFGLGRTNNYIEEFLLGMPINSHRYSNMWPSIIPNTQIVASPHPLFAPNRWTLELSLSPSMLFLPILWATLASLVFIGAIIFFLHQKEKREDSEERKGFRSHFIVH